MANTADQIQITFLPVKWKKIKYLTKLLLSKFCWEFYNLQDMYGTASSTQVFLWKSLQMRKIWLNNSIYFFSEKTDLQAPEEASSPQGRA